MILSIGIITLAFIIATIPIGEPIGDGIHIGDTPGIHITTGGIRGIHTPIIGTTPIMLMVGDIMITIGINLLTGTDTMVDIIIILPETAVAA